MLLEALQASMRLDSRWVWIGGGVACAHTWRAAHWHRARSRGSLGARCRDRDQAKASPTQNDTKSLVKLRDALGNQFVGGAMITPASKPFPSGTAYGQYQCRATLDIHLACRRAMDVDQKSGSGACLPV